MLKKAALKTYYKLQSNVAYRLSTMPEALLEVASLPFSHDQVANADAQMKLLMGVQKHLSTKGLVDDDLKQSRIRFNTQMKELQLKNRVLFLVEDLKISRPDNTELTVRRYVPENPEQAGEATPLIVFFHGGGFALGNIDTHDGFCRLAAEHTGFQVISVDYRLAPEAPAPAQFEDCKLALEYAHAHAAELGVDPKRIGVAGDSAGGNLAAVVAQQTHGTAVEPKAQLLIYPAVDSPTHYPSTDRYGSGLPLSYANKMRFDHLYVNQSGIDPKDPIISPMYGKLKGLCPAVVITAEMDILCDEGEAYARAMQKQGVSVDLDRVFGVPHGFINMIDIHPGCYRETTRFLSRFAAKL